jgi:lipocalin
MNKQFTLRLSPALIKGTLLATVVLVGMKAWASSKEANPRSDLATVPTLDLPRYLGQWYEIAKFPNRFQRKCTGFTTAIYTALPDGRVQVENRCRTADGGTDVAVGVARQVGGGDSPRLKVRFAPAALSFIPQVWGDYWVGRRQRAGPRLPVDPVAHADGQQAGLRCAGGAPVGPGPRRTQAGAHAPGVKQDYHPQCYSENKHSRHQ